MNNNIWVFINENDDIQRTTKSEWVEGAKVHCPRY